MGRKDNSTVGGLGLGGERRLREPKQRVKGGGCAEAEGTSGAEPQGEIHPGSQNISSSPLYYYFQTTRIMKSQRFNLHQALMELSLILCSIFNTSQKR